MNNYNIIAEAGAGYYIQLDATPEQAENINLMLGGAA